MAKVTKFYAESGLSWKDAKENWYKATAGIELEIDEKDDIKEVKKKAWNTVNTEVEKQLKDIIEGKE